MRVDQLLPRATLYFDLRSPYTYLVAERADRLFDGLDWRPASADVLHGDLDDDAPGAVADRARLLGLPLVWPEDRPYRVLRAMRVASLAVERGCGGAFVLAASRLAFCGGFDLDDPEILAEAAAAAGISLDDAFHAAGDVARDGPIEAAARMLLAAGAERLPVLKVGRALFSGEDRLMEAAAAARAAV
ncbi:MAG TPA: DsbA family protein [Solirubrobacteraceae bacterium]|nr:DsbA family protein [Solirubrobacteraceae bacterium]